MAEFILMLLILRLAYSRMLQHSESQCFFFQGKVRLSYVVFECYERFERREEKNKKDGKNRFIAAVYLQV